MHFASFKVASVKDLQLYYRGHLSNLSFLWTLKRKGETEIASPWEKPKWHYMIGVLQTAEPQKCYHVTRISERQTKTNGP